MARRLLPCLCNILICMYPSYETIAAQSGHYPFVEVYQFLSAGAYQFTGAGDTAT
jgi:hypothetical protein